MCDLNTDRTDEEGRRRREGGPGIKWPKEGERRGEEGDKLPIKWVSGIWDAIAYRVRILISDRPRASVICVTRNNYSKH